MSTLLSADLGKLPISMRRFHHFKLQLPDHQEPKPMFLCLAAVVPFLGKGPEATMEAATGRLATKPQSA